MCSVSSLETSTCQEYAPSPSKKKEKKVRGQSLDTETSSKTMGYANLKRIPRVPWWLSGLKIWCCHELQCRSQMRLRSRFAVAVAKASSCSSDLTPSLGAFICLRYSPEKTKKTKTNDKCCVFLKKINGILLYSRRV